VPWDYDLDAYKGEYDGVFISNGPGDPKTCKPTIASLQKALKKNVLTFGICLGNQLMALAVGGDTYKLKYGHRGANQPCIEVRDGVEGRCIITSQNHGFAVDEKSLPNGWKVWWKNANDGTVEGIRHDSGRFFAVQFHPEATPGPEDANYLFDEFVDLMKKERAQK
jgi:carbamoyl-phosphate synthase small subunit